MPTDNSGALERAMENLAESLDRLADSVDSGNRQTSLNRSGGRTTTPSSRGGGGGDAGGLLGRRGAIAGVAGIAAQQTLRFGKAAAKAGFSSFVSSRGSIGFEGAVTNGTIAALRLIPGGDSIVDRRLGPSERALSRARGVLEPILRGGGLQDKGRFQNVANQLFSRFRVQEKRVQDGREFFKEKLAKETTAKGGILAEDLRKLGKEMAEGFIKRMKDADVKEFLDLRGALGPFGIPRAGGK